MDENIDRARMVTQHIVGRTAHNDATLSVGKLMYKVALSPVKAVARYRRAAGIAVYIIQPHGKRKQAVDKRRKPLVIALEKLLANTRLPGSLRKKLFVIVSKTETVGQFTAKHTSPAAKLASDSDYNGRIIQHSDIFVVLLSINISQI